MYDSRTPSLTSLLPRRRNTIALLEIDIERGKPLEEAHVDQRRGGLEEEGSKRRARRA
jgi:hypothetical protein